MTHNEILERAEAYVQAHLQDVAVELLAMYEQSPVQRPHLDTIAAICRELTKSATPGLSLAETLVTTAALKQVAAGR